MGLRNRRSSRNSLVEIGKRKRVLTKHGAGGSAIVVGRRCGLQLKGSCVIYERGLVLALLGVGRMTIRSSPRGGALEPMRDATGRVRHGQVHAAISNRKCTTIDGAIHITAWALQPLTRSARSEARNEEHDCQRDDLEHSSSHWMFPPLACVVLSAPARTRVTIRKRGLGLPSS